MAGKLSTAEKIINFLKRSKGPKTPKQIAKGARVNYNTCRRVVVELFDVGRVRSNEVGFYFV